MGAVIAAIVARKQREVLEQFTDSGATSAAAAQFPSDIGLDASDRFFRMLERDSVLRDVGDGRYYFDADAYERLRRSRIRLVLVIIAALVIAGVILAMMSKPAH